MICRTKIHPSRLPTERVKIGGSNGSVTKVERYGWSVTDKPGEQMSIAKNLLKVDHTYQREVKHQKTLALAAKWSWIACGALIVARRNGEFWVIDGQHRLFAAMQRQDIIALPCIVFSSDGAATEAEGFLQANKNRKPISGYDTLRARFMKGKAAILITNTVERLGIQISRQKGEGETTIQCVGRLLKMADKDAPALECALVVAAIVCRGTFIPEKLITGLWYLQTKGVDLTDGRFEQRISQVGLSAITESIRAVAPVYSGFEAQGANGILKAVNHGLRNRFEMSGSSA